MIRPARAAHFSVCRIANGANGLGAKIVLPAPMVAVLKKAFMRGARTAIG